MADDIIDLSGGVSAVLERARQKFSNGDHEQAIHLLDIIRDAGADSAESRELGARVHEALLEKTDNFWLSSWLQNQVNLLKA